MSLFPSKQYTEASEYLAAYADAVKCAFATIDSDAIGKAARCLEETVNRRATIFVCGNGGSAAIANHFVCDHVKGASTGTDFRPRVASLSTNIEIVTAVANDIGYANVFEFQLSSAADPGDLLFTISSSGSSPNIVAAINWARKNQVTSISMTGFGGGDSRKLADISLHVDAQNYGVVEDVHQSLMHVLAQFLRQKRLLEPSQIGSVKF